MFASALIPVSILYKQPYYWKKLKIFPAELIARDQVANRYSDLLGDQFQVPRLQIGITSAWAQYTLVLRERDRIQSLLKAQEYPAQSTTRYH